MTGGGGPTGGDMEGRVRALETNFEKMDGKLDKILDRLAAHDVKLASLDGKLETIDAKLDTKASATDLARIAGRVEALPTTWQMITLAFGILGGAFLILRFGLVHAP